LSEDAAFDNFEISGRSAVSLLWTAYSLGTSGGDAILSEKPYYTIEDLCKAGIVRDVPGKHVIDVLRDESSITVTYQDERFPRLLMVRPRHPDDY
jgi:hypothetical protein